MKSKKSLTEKELEEWENSRDLSAELLESVRQIRIVMSPMISTPKKSGLSQAEFAKRHPDVLKCTSSHLSTYEFFS